jgi:hypothetical protein
MNSEQRIDAFAALGCWLSTLTGPDFDEMCQNAANENPWFTRVSIHSAVTSISRMLRKDALTDWVHRYPAIQAPRTIALILAGNIPLVGFHDIVSVLISGHRAMIKLSSKDKYLVNRIIDKLIETEPRLAGMISIVEQLKGFDAVIATGSDNSARYFDYYFGKYPNIIRKNRTSVAVLSGNESPEDLTQLGRDVFTYFGLGCRNVSKLFIPQEFSFEKLFVNWEIYSEVLNHHKYHNNYDYQKSILLINREPFLDNGFVLLQKSARIVSPISVVYFEEYISESDIEEKLASVSGKIQVTVGSLKTATVPFGKAQAPEIDDYADNVDTMKFLTSF